MISNNLKLIATVNLDFYTNNIKTINVKQYDSKSRYIQVSFTEHGKKFSLNKDTMSVITRYKKADGKYGLQDCEIFDDGTAMIQTTEQMLAVPGKCRLDVVILESNGLHVENFCDVTSFDDIDCAILSTMPLDLNVIACPINDGELQSEYDFTSLNESLAATKTAQADLISKNAEWAKAESNRVEAEKQREKNVDEAVDKTNTAISNANKATTSATNAAGYADSAATKADNASEYAKSQADRCMSITDDCEKATSRANLAAQDCENIVAGSVGGESLGLVKNGGNVFINPDGTMTAPEGGDSFNPEPTFAETDKYYFEGEEEQLVLANHGITLPFEGVTSAYKLNAEITKEQLDAITSIRLVSFVNWDMFRFDLTQPLAENTYGSIYSLGDLGIIIVGFDIGTIPLTLSPELSINVPIPSEGIFIVIPDRNYYMLANNCMLVINGGTITAKKYEQIDDKYLATPPDLNLDIPDDIGSYEGDGIRMRGAGETYGSGFAAGSGAKALNVGAFALGGDCTTEGYDAKSMGTQAHASGDNATAMGYYVWARGKNSTIAGGFRNEADGEASFAANRFNKAIGWASAVFGSDNIAKGSHSFAEGACVIATGQYQHAQGKYNIEDTASKYAHIIGGGTSNSDRKNIHTVDWNGNAYYETSLTLGNAKLEYDSVNHRLVISVG